MAVGSWQLAADNPLPTANCQPPTRSPQLLRHPQRPFDTHIAVDVIELREAAEEPQPRGRDRLAHGGDVLAVVEVVHRISVNEADDLAITNGLRIEQLHRLEVAQHAR